MGESTLGRVLIESKAKKIQAASEAPWRNLDRCVERRCQRQIRVKTFLNLGGRSTVWTDRKKNIGLRAKPCCAKKNGKGQRDAWPMDGVP